VALFTGCASEFVYPEESRAAVRLLRAKGASVVYPGELGCCGLPAQASGWRRISREMAARNAGILDRVDADWIVSPCPSCASHLRNGYPRILDGDAVAGPKALAAAGRVADLAWLLKEVLGYGPDDFARDGERVAFHSSCHQCRGLGGGGAARELLRDAAEYVETSAEDLCCGFGGAYSLKFPETSAAIMERKLKSVEGAGVQALVAFCPGCVMQLRGGEDRRGKAVRVEHAAEFLAGRLRAGT
jgi:Fe-S oxidoreductase